MLAPSPLGKQLPPLDHLHKLEEALLAGDAPFTASRLPSAILHGIPRYGWYRLLHEGALAAGASCYQDPISCELVATAAFLNRHPELCAGRIHRHGRDLDLSVQLAGLSDVPVPGGFSDPDDSDSSISQGSRTSSANSSFDSSFRPLVTSGPDDRHWGAPCMQVLRFNKRAAATSGAYIPQQWRNEADNETSNRRHHAPHAQGPSPCRRKQSRPLIVSDLPDMEDILKLPHYAQTGRLHGAAESRGLDSYRDPQNGYSFHTRSFLSREQCCGEDCRHCPYGWQHNSTGRERQRSGWLSSSEGSSSSSSCSCDESSSYSVSSSDEC